MQRDYLAIVRLVREDTNQGVGRDIAISGRDKDKTILYQNRG